MRVSDEDILDIETRTQDFLGTRATEQVRALLDELRRLRRVADAAVKWRDLGEKAGWVEARVALLAALHEAGL